MCGKLGTLFARARHEVVFSYARRHEKLKKLVQDVHGNARAGTLGEATQEVDRCPLAGCALVPNGRRVESDR